MGHWMKRRAWLGLIAAIAMAPAGARAQDWLAAASLPARLTGHDGRVCRLAGWPAGDGRPVPVPPGSYVYAGGPR